MKELPFFKFFPAEYLQGDITFESLELQGVFILVCSHYWSANCDITFEKMSKRLPANSKKSELFLKNLIEKNIIKVDNDKIIISFLDEQLIELKELKEKRSKAGLSGVEAKRKQRLSKGKANLKHKDKDKDKDIIPTTGVVYNNYYDNELLTLNAKKTDVSVCAPEISTYCANYEKFIKYLFGNNDLGQKIDHVLKLEQQLSFDQFVKLSQKAGEPGKLKMKFDSLINNPKYSKGKKSIYLIINNWLNLDDKR